MEISVTGNTVKLRRRIVDVEAVSLPLKLEGKGKERSEVEMIGMPVLDVEHGEDGILWINTAAKTFRQSFSSTVMRGNINVVDYPL